MIGAETIIEQIFILIILSLAGVIAALFKIISPELKKGLASLIIKIIIPVMLITSLSELNISAEIIKNSIWVIIFAYLSIFILIGIGFLSAKISGLKPDTAVTHVMHTGFGNVIFLGFPVLNELFPGGEALLYAALYHLASSTVMWTVGILILSKEKKVSFISNLKNLINPNTIALIIGLLMIIFSFKLPEILHKPLKGLGDSTIYLAMIYIGAVMTEVKLKSLFKKLHIFILSFNKLLLGPIIFMVVIYFLILWFDISIGNIAIATLILETAMPCMAIIIILIKAYDRDDQTAVANFFVTTILSIITLPLIYYIFTKIFIYTKPL